MNFKIQKSNFLLGIFFFFFYLLSKIMYLSVMSIAVIWLFVVCFCFVLLCFFMLTLWSDWGGGHRRLVCVVLRSLFLYSEQQFQTLQQPNPLLSPLMTTFSTSDPWSDEMKTCVCAKKLHSHVVLITGAMRNWLACSLGLTHTFCLFHQLMC